eukprot:4019358-Alexandrium_andersonii.AAC.1
MAASWHQASATAQGRGTRGTQAATSNWGRSTRRRAMLPLGNATSEKHLYPSHALPKAQTEGLAA